MEIKAKAKFIRMSPRKVRLVASVIRGMKLANAIDQLHFVKKKAVTPIIKLVNSAVANATNNFDLEKNNLYIKEIKVDEGPTLHRWMPKARGRATPIRKRSSHISLILGELVDSGKAKAKQQKIEAPIKLGAKPKEDEGIKIKDKSSEAKENLPAKSSAETGKKIIDPRGEGKGKHTKIEGASHRGFVSKMFRRKSG